VISVLIVTYNSARCIAACLESLRKFAPGAEVIVVDNASMDGTVDIVRRFAEVKLVASPDNLGFAGGVNRAARESSGDSLLILNPDTICRTLVQPLEDLLNEDATSVAVAPQLVDAHGKFQRGFAIRRLPTRTALIFELLLINRLFPQNPVNHRYRCLDFDAESVTEVEQPAGACLLVRRRSFDECGGMDERFFPLWFEDVDLCLRLRKQSGRIVYDPRVVMMHQGGHSLESVTFHEKQVYWYRNLLYYEIKHHGRRTGTLIRAALLVGIGLRVIAELIAAVLNRKTPVAIRAERVRGYGRAALVAISAGESRPRVRP
jgi:GT2 family glycosyltransferase